MRPQLCTGVNLPSAPGAQRERGTGRPGGGRAAPLPGPEITRGTCPAPSQKEGPTSKSGQNEVNV